MEPGQAKEGNVGRAGRKAFDPRKLITEAMVEKLVLDWLAVHKFRVQNTQVHGIWSAAPGEEAKPRKGYGASRGTGDLFIRRDWYPPFCWLMIELKKPVGWRYSSREQRELCELGLSAVVTSIEDLVAAVARFESYIPEASRKAAKFWIGDRCGQDARAPSSLRSG